MNETVNQGHMTNGESENFGPISRDLAAVGRRMGRMYMGTEKRDMKAKFGRPP